MRLLLRSNTGEFNLTKDFVGDDSIPPYAILSHTWGPDEEEVTFDDLTNGTGKEKLGYEKIRFCEEQAGLDGLQYFWIDTCCINKENDAELSRSVNSMFRWYRNATRCYVYLSDVSTTSFTSNRTKKLTKPWESDFRKSRWFTRGWTLQELLAPASVEFFSKERERLGDKSSLRQQIHEITNISHSALQGGPLSQFSVEERLQWIEHRQTKLEEDKAYSLLGIFGVYIAPIYGEGIATAFKRLIDEIDKQDKCIQDLHLTDPRNDKKRIEETKGGLLEDSYRWILENSDFQRWRDDPQSRLLWIKGDPGKGKTMLLCGIINELNKSITITDQLSYFFCQATDSRINSATTVLRGLLYLLVNQQPSLISHIRKKHDHAAKALFEDVNAWVALSEIMTSMLQDSRLNSTYLIVDALDECVVDLPKLLNFIVDISASSARVKWLLSSRNELHIEQKLRFADERTRLSLELKENAQHVSRAVDVYIDDKLSRVESLQDDDLRGRVRDILRRKANGTFLWVALVVQELERPQSWDPLLVVEEVPTGLHELYDRMVNQIQYLKKRDSEICRLILSIATVVYRPLHLAEIGSLCGLQDSILELTRKARTIVAMCGSFLAVRDDRVYIIHQSARDYLCNEAHATIFLSREWTHHNIFSRSLELMSRVLQRDMYRLKTPSFPIDQVQVPAADPLAAARYSSVYWVDHLHDWNPPSVATHGIDPQDIGVIETFIKEKYLYWLEALSLIKSMPEGVVAMAKLNTLAQRRADTPGFMRLLQDARLFIMYHIQPIQKSPLQAYVSALIFSPEHSLIRSYFKKEEPRWITAKPVIGDQWSACLQTFEGHSDYVLSVAFSHDSSRLASSSSDGTAKIWDASSGVCLQTLKGHSGGVTSVAFSDNSARVVSSSSDGTVKIWDASSGDCLRTFERHSSGVNSVAFSHDSARVASASSDCTVKIWDTSSGMCLYTLQEHSSWVYSVAFSHDSARLASSSSDGTAKIWDASSGVCLQTLKGHSGGVTSVAFSHDSAQLASASSDCTVKIWDASSGNCLYTFKGHSSGISSVAFSQDSARVASSSSDYTVKIWDASSGACLQTRKGHDSGVTSVAFSHDSAQLASASSDSTVKIWDASSDCPQAFKGHSRGVTSVVFSQDSAQVASASDDKTVKIWDTSSGVCLYTLKGHSNWVYSVAFSHDSAWLASASSDSTVKIWDASSGNCLHTFKGHSGGVTSMAFSHDSAWLASWSSSDGTVNIWNVSSGACLQTLKGHSYSVRSVAFSHDSARLASASASDDGTVKIWDASSGACLQTLKGHSRSVTSVVFSYNSAWVASASYDCTIRIWDVSSGACLQTLWEYTTVKLLAFSHDSARLVSASDDKTVKIWDASTRDCVQTLRTCKLLNRVSFDITDSYLHTDIGAIDIRARAGSPLPLTSSEPRSSRYQGLGLSADTVWITHNSENLVWLPSEYRPSCLAVSGNTISIGVGTGRVWMCKVELDIF